MPICISITCEILENVDKEIRRKLSLVWNLLPQYEDLTSQVFVFFEKYFEMGILVSFLHT